MDDMASSRTTRGRADADARVLARATCKFIRASQLSIALASHCAPIRRRFSIQRGLQELQRIVGLDQDASALDIARAHLSGLAAQADLVHCNFRCVTGASALERGIKAHKFAQHEVVHRELSEQLAARELDSGVDGILLDLGVSSMQLDRADRGFSFSQDGPLDMRMDAAAARTARDIVNCCSEQELGRMLREYGEEKAWRTVARRIADARCCIHLDMWSLQPPHSSSLHALCIHVRYGLEVSKTIAATVSALCAGTTTAP